jgi:hypothetical protein
MGAIAGQQLVATLVALGFSSRKELRGEQALGQVVDRRRRTGLAGEAK